MERDMISAVVSLAQDTVVDAKCACNEVEEKEHGVLIDIGMQADFRVEICGNSFAFSGFRFHDGSLYEEDAKGIAYDEGVVARG